MRIVLIIISIILLLGFLPCTRCEPSPENFIELEGILLDSLLRRLKLDSAKDRISFDAVVKKAYPVGTHVDVLMPRVFEAVGSGGFSDTATAIVVEVKRDRIIISSIYVKSDVKYDYWLAWMFDKKSELVSLVHGLSVEAWKGPPEPEPERPKR